MNASQMFVFVIMALALSVDSANKVVFKFVSVVILATINQVTIASQMNVNAKTAKVLTLANAQYITHKAVAHVQKAIT